MDSMHAYKYKILDDGIYKYDWIKENKRNTRIFKLQKQPRIHLSMVGKKKKAENTHRYMYKYIQNYT